jgi:hypothetical protein
VGGSSPEELLEHPDHVQVGGDQFAQFVRRWGSRRRIVPWPLEGYWWGGLTSLRATRALWSLLIPLLLCNLAAWAAPAPPNSRSRAARPLPLVGRCLAVTMRWAGYVLTLVLTASVATASIDTFGWQCTSPGGACQVRWLGWVPTATGPRMTLFALVPVIVVAAIWYASHRTVNSYERWRIRRPEEAASGSVPAWPLTAEGFWHGLLPVRRLQLLHLAGAAGLVSLYLAWAPDSHPGWRIAAVSAALVIISASGLLLAMPGAGRPGVNPFTPTRPPASAPGGFDWLVKAFLAVSLALLAALLVARLWWPAAAPPTGHPGVLPGDAGIWEGLSIAMGALVVAAFVLTAAARAVIWRTAAEPGADDAAQPASAPSRPFACGFLGPFALGLACVTGGMFAAGVNLAVPRLLIGSTFKVGTMLTGGPSAPTIELPWPLFGFMTALLAIAAAMILVLFYAGFRYLVKAAVIRKRLLNYYADAAKGSPAQLRRIARQWTLSRTADLIGLVVAASATAGVAAVLAFHVVNPRQTVVASVIGSAQWLAGVAAVALYGFTVAAFTDRGKRTMIGVLWDVGTFWPRACQPFAPPCYMERAVPELVNRLNGLLAPADPVAHARQAEALAVGQAGALATRLGANADKQALADALGELTPHYRRILVNGYSQGAPIAAAAIAQLRQTQVSAISLVTVGSPLRRLYGRGFPAYFGPHSLGELRTLLGGPGAAVRWRNAVRKSDYIGDFTFQDPYGRSSLVDAGPIDKAVLDPPCVVPNDGDGATLPPIHGHSDFWPDPQVAVLTNSLLDIAGGSEQGGQASMSQPPQPAEVSQSSTVRSG